MVTKRCEQDDNENKCRKNAPSYIVLRDVNINKFILFLEKLKSSSFVTVYVYRIPYSVRQLVDNCPVWSGSISIFAL